MSQNYTWKKIDESPLVCLKVESWVVDQLILLSFHAAALRMKRNFQRSCVKKLHLPSDCFCFSPFKVWIRVLSTKFGRRLKPGCGHVFVPYLTIGWVCTVVSFLYRPAKRMGNVTVIFSEMCTCSVSHLLCVCSMFGYEAYLYCIIIELLCFWTAAAFCCSLMILSTY